MNHLKPIINKRFIVIRKCNKKKYKDEKKFRDTLQFYQARLCSSGDLYRLDFIVCLHEEAKTLSPHSLFQRAITASPNAQILVSLKEFKCFVNRLNADEVKDEEKKSYCHWHTLPQILWILCIQFAGNVFTCLRINHELNHIGKLPLTWRFHCFDHPIDIYSQEKLLHAQAIHLQSCFLDPRGLSVFNLFLVLQSFGNLTDLSIPRSCEAKTFDPLISCAIERTLTLVGGMKYLVKLTLPNLAYDQVLVLQTSIQIHKGLQKLTTLSYSSEYFDECFSLLPSLTAIHYSGRPLFKYFPTLLSGLTDLTITRGILTSDSVDTLIGLRRFVYSPVEYPFIEDPQPIHMILKQNKSTLQTFELSVCYEYRLDSTLFANLTSLTLIGVNANDLNLQYCRRLISLSLTLDKFSSWKAGSELIANLVSLIRLQVLGKISKEQFFAIMHLPKLLVFTHDVFPNFPRQVIYMALIQSTALCQLLHGSGEHINENLTRALKIRRAAKNQAVELPVKVCL